MGDPSTYQCRAWGRRADTILRKAEELLDDMLAVIGCDHELTDYADGAVETAETLAQVLQRYPDMLKYRAAAKSSPHREGTRIEKEDEDGR